jgi:hypothetical protein
MLRIWGPIECFSVYQNRQTIANRITGALRVANESAVEFDIERQTVAISNQALSNLAVDLNEFGWTGQPKRGVA